MDPSAFRALFRDRCSWVHPGDANGHWVPYLEAYFAWNPWPLYDMSSQGLSFDGKRIRWSVVNECLLVVKYITWLGKYKIRLVMPPMSRDGSAERESEVLRWAFRAKFGAMMSQAAYERYDLGHLKTTPVREEYLYRAGDYAPDKTRGPKWSKWRNARNNAQERGWVTKTWSWEDIPTEAIHEIVAISERWRVERDKNSTFEVRLAKSFLKMGSPFFVEAGARWVNLFYNPEGKAMAWTAFDEVGPGKAVDLIRHWVGGEYPGRDGARHIHMEDDRVLVERLGEGAVYTMGGIGRLSQPNEGLHRAKRKLRPVQTLLLRQYDQTMTRAEWDATR